PFDGFFVPLCVEIQVAELDARRRVGRLAFRNRLKRPHLGIVEYGGPRGRLTRGCRGRGWRSGVTHARLLAADNPPGQQPESNPRDSEGDGVRFHRQITIIADHWSGARRTQDAQVLADHVSEAEKQRAGDDGVSNRYFGQMGQLSKEHQVVEVEVVPGVHTETKRSSELSRPDVLLE